MRIWCPGCMEKVDKELVVKNGFKCPLCAFDFKAGDEFSTDDFDDLMMTDFAADGDLDGKF